MRNTANRIPFGVSPYKIYVALLTQTGSSAPTAEVLENSIGEIVWARSTNGTYTATLAGAFTASKTVVLMGTETASPSAGLYNTPKAVKTSADIITVLTSRLDVAGGAVGIVDDILSATEIEIRVYP